MTVDGGIGNDTLTYTGNTVDRTVTLTSDGAINGFSGTASGIAGFRNINWLVGGSGTNSLNGLNGGLWTVVNATDVVYTSGNNLPVTGFEALSGGAGNDNFSFAGFATPRNLTMANVGALDGFDLDRRASFNGSFYNINTLIGGVSSNQLNGANLPLTWTIDGLADRVTDRDRPWHSPQSKPSTAARRWTHSDLAAQRQHLNAGAGADVFNFAAGTNLTGILNGQGGSDTFNYVSFGAPVTVTLSGNGSCDGFNGSGSGLTGTFANINALMGTAGVDT